MEPPNHSDDWRWATQSPKMTSKAIVWNEEKKNYRGQPYEITNYRETENRQNHVQKEKKYKGLLKKSPKEMFMSISV